MGFSAAGIVILENTKLMESKKVLLEITGKTHYSINLLDRKNSSYGINKADSYIEDFENCSILHNKKLVTSILFDNSDEYKRAYYALKKPTLMIVFCHYDSGGSYGYAIIKNGEKIRSRVQIEVETTREFGEPLHFENEWLNAERYYPEDPRDDGEYYTIPGNNPEFRCVENFTSDLLSDCFKHYLGFHPIYDREKRKITAYNLTPKQKHNPTIDSVLSHWNWGAFLCNWVWAIYHRRWIGLLVLIPYMGLPIAIILGLKGNKWAWESKPWEDINTFVAHQKKWALAGLLFWVTIFVFVAYIKKHS